MRRRYTENRRDAGFTIIEILVVITIVALIAVTAIQTMTFYVPRFRLRNAASETAALMNKARLEAIRRGITTVVEFDYADRSITAFADFDGNLASNPDLLARPDRTDYQIGYIFLPGPDVAGVHFGGPVDGLQSIAAPGKDAVVGFTPVVGKPSVLVFRPNGAVDTPGAVRFTDNLQQNFLETSVANLTGQTEVRKYLLEDDSPTGVADFFAEGNVSFDAGSVGKNVWNWY